jgi:hypothetical protein
MLSAAQLYALVAGYARMGDHRTGTAVDQATLTWLTGLLTGLGADVSHDLYAFDRYDAHVTVRIDGVAVDCLPLPYSGLGVVRDRDPGRAVLAPVAPDDLGGLDDVRVQAAAGGHGALVVATATGHGGLFALNHSPAASAGLPVVLVAEEHAPSLRSTAAVDVALEALIAPGFSSNLLASWGAAPDLPYILVTTPLTGWFACAGERGSGIAIAVSLAAELARDWPVLLLGATGHELDGLGAQHHLSHRLPAPGAVLHVGASAAAVGHVPGRLSEHVRIAVSCVGLEAELALTGHPVHDAHAVGWRGEASRWASYGVPMVSVAGATPLFHTSEDRLPAATTPALLGQVRDGLLAGARRLAEQALGAPAAATPR